MPKILSIQDKNGFCIQSLTGGKSKQEITGNMIKVTKARSGTMVSLLPSPHSFVQVNQHGEHNTNITKTY